MNENNKLKGYFQAFEPENNYERLMFRSGKGLQSRELNDIQAQVAHQVKGIADVLLKDGDIVSEGDVIVDKDQQHVSLGPSSIYLAGHVRHLPSAVVAIELDQRVEVGVWLAHQVITELDDPDLRDPAAGAQNYKEAGAARLQAQFFWGLRTDRPDDNAQFYPVHYIVNGTLVVKQPSPQLDGMTRALARYDRQSNGGNYVVDGLVFSYRDQQGDQQVFSLAEGKAHIQGFEVAFHTARQQAFDYDPDIRTVEHEPHLFKPDQNGQMVVNLSFSPVKTVDRVTVVAQKTIEVTRRSGREDPLIDDAISDIVLIKSRNTTYQSGEDYQFNNNRLVWVNANNKPDSGNTYQVTYEYFEQIEIEPTETGFVLQKQYDDLGITLVDKGTIAVDYTWKMPRIDLVALDLEGHLKRVKGHPHPFRPLVPKAPDGQLVLAEIHQHWRHEQEPEIKNIAIQAVPMSSLKQMQQQIADLYQLVAIERLQNNANASDPSTKFGVFVDPFLDDDLRDQGIEQTAAIIDGELQLPVTAQVNELIQSDNLTLPYQLCDVLVQIRRSGSMKVNPYKAFEPIPASVSLHPSVDHWVDISRNQRSEVSRLFVRSSGGRVSERFERRVTSVTHQRQFLRQRYVSFTLNGFGATETLTRIVFDGIEIEARHPHALRASEQGVIRNEFRVPPRVATGTKLVEFYGSGGSRGQARYTGSNQIRIETIRNIRTILFERYDPLAQTFTLSQTQFIAGVELWFTDKGPEDVRVQIRETTVGMPNQVILAEASLSSHDISLSDATLFEFFPILLNEGQEYAIVVLTDGAAHEVAIAEMGQYDRNYGWITSQAYQTGVLLSSSNASTWTPHQGKDLTFRLKAAHFTQTHHEIELGEIEINKDAGLAKVSDLIALAVAERPSSQTDVRFLVSSEHDDQPLHLQEWQPLNLTESMQDTKLTVKACLSGTAQLSPVLFSGSQLVVGELAESADYVTRAITCQPNSVLKITFETSDTAGVDVYVQDSSQAKPWVKLTNPQHESLDNGWETCHFTYTLGEITAYTTRVKLVLTGDSRNRPKVKSLRAFSVQAQSA